VGTRDQSFPRNAEFSAKRWNLPVSAQFMFSQNSVLAGDKGTNAAHFSWVEVAVEN